MKKILNILIVLLVFTVVITSVKATPVKPVCVTDENAYDLWSVGYVNLSSGNPPREYNYCAGNSDNLKQLRCDDGKVKEELVHCFKLNAECTTVVLDGTEKGFCSCNEGYTLNSDRTTCVPKNEVPEFGVIAAGVALIGAVGIVLYKRH